MNFSKPLIEARVAEFNHLNVATALQPILQNYSVYC
jgi:hypothetical protein